MAVKLGEMLVKAGLVSQDQVQEALQSQKTNGEKLGFNLIRLGYVQEDEITQLLSEQYGVPSINLRHFEIDESVINLIPSEVSQKYLVLPVNRTGATGRTVIRCLVTSSSPARPAPSARRSDPCRP